MPLYAATVWGLTAGSGPSALRPLDTRPLTTRRQRQLLVLRVAAAGDDVALDLDRPHSGSTCTLPAFSALFLRAHHLPVAILTQRHSKKPRRRRGCAASSIRVARRRQQPGPTASALLSLAPAAEPALFAPVRVGLKISVTPRHLDDEHAEAAGGLLAPARDSTVSVVAFGLDGHAHVALPWAVASRPPAPPCLRRPRRARAGCS